MSFSEITFEESFDSFATKELSDNDEVEELSENYKKLGKIAVP